jgi:hypothetical protein
VIIVQDIHQVIGREELEFERVYREELAPAIASAETSLCYFGWLPHGAGEGYEAVTLTSCSNGNALDRYQERLRAGEIGSTWTGLEAKRYGMRSSVHALGAGVEDWQSRISPRATTPGTLHRLDIVELDRPVTDVAPLLNSMVAEESSTRLLTPLAWWEPVFGGLEGHVVSVLGAVTSELTRAFDAVTANEVLETSAEAVLGDAVIRTTHRLLRPPAW